MNELTYSTTIRKLKTVFGLFISFLIICCSVAATLGIMYVKELMHGKNYDDKLINIAVPLMNFIAAKIFSIIYDVVSKKLNNYENHKSITQFEDSLIYKIFFFNVMNSFNSFLVLAFVKI